MIDQNTINRILNTARIEEVVGEFVSLRRRGANHWGLCPFHDEKTPSFSVSPAKGIYKCFGCGKGGGVVHFVMDHEQLSYTDALKWLAAKYHIEVVEKELTPEELQRRNERESLFVVNEFARDWFCDTLHNTPEGRNIGLAYFQQERGLREDIIRRFQLGYCTDRFQDFSNQALKKGYSLQSLLDTGLSIQTESKGLMDRYRGRVIFPVHTLSGKVVAFGGRILKKAENTGKYVNSPQSAIYDKSLELYGMYQSKQSIVKENRCLLVEGYLDVISMHQAGITNVVASSGTSLTHGQIRLIHRFTENVTVIYDGDSAGIKASLRGINLLLEEGLNIKVVLLPDGEDPDSYAQHHSSSEVLAYIAEHQEDFIQFKTRILLQDSAGDPVRRAQVIGDIVDSIALIPNALVRSEYLKECARRLNSREELLVEECNKRRSTLLEQARQKRRYEATAQAEAAEARDQAGIGESAPISIEEAPSGSSAGATVPSSPASTRGRVDRSAARKLRQYEYNLLRMVVRYGERPLFEEDGAVLSVIDFVRQELENDEVEFSDSLFAKMFCEGCESLNQEGFIAERFYLSHPDADVSRMAAEMLNEPYELSRLYTANNEENKLNFNKKMEREEDLLPQLVPHLIEDLKFRILKQKLQEAADRIKQAEREGKRDESLQWLQEYQYLQSLEKEFAKVLGERIISL